MTGTLGVDHGGTGATTASGARTNLGLGSMATETAANYLKLSGGTMTGPLKWTGNTALPEKQSLDYFLTIDSFGNGGTTYWVSKANAKTALGLNNVDNTSDAEKEIYEANLLWGGKNFSYSYGPIDAAMVSELGANRLMFTKGEAVTIEYSRDGGSTWTDYGATNVQKTALFSSGGDFKIGKADSTNKATANGTNYQLRVTIDTGAANIYTALNKFVIYISTNGSNNCSVTIQKALQSSPDTFVNHDATEIPISGWSGYNIINISSLTTYGNNSASQYGRVRFLFKANGGSTSYIGLSILKIMGFGGVGWFAPSTMAKTGHLYSFDASQNATFPAGITATSFSGPLTGDVTGNAATATKSGVSDIWLYPENANEINFGGTTTNTAIIFGYRAKDSRPIPSKFIFGGSTGTAELQVSKVYLGSGTSSYISSTTYTGTAANVTGTVSVNHGGTGATTAESARSNLGLGSIAVKADTDYIKYNGIDTSQGNGTPSASVKTYWANNEKIPKGSVVFAYNSSGVESTILYSNNNNQYGTILKWSYANRYIYILRAHPTNGTYSGWLTQDWEKIDAGYADSAGSVALSGVSGADDLKAIEALSGTSGFLKKTAANTWTLDTNTYLTSSTGVTSIEGKTGALTLADLGIIYSTDTPSSPTEGMIWLKPI